MKKRRLVIKIIGKTQKKMDPLEVAKALGASRMGKVNFPHYYMPSNFGKIRNLLKKRLSDSSETEMVKKVLGTIGAIWLKKDQRLSFANLILPVLKPGMSNLVFMEALRKYYGEKKTKKH